MARPKNAKPTVRCTVTIDLTSAKRLEAVARSQDVSVSWVVRRAIEMFLESHDDATPQLPLQRVAPRRNR
jgi:Ribbon-helix-helix protein, copG family